MSKSIYHEVNKKLQRVPTARSERVNALKAEMGPRQSTELARDFAALRKEQKEIEAALSAVNERLEAVTDLLADAYLAEGVTSVRILETGQTVSVQYEPYAAVVDKDAHRRWAIANGYENALALPWGTTNMITKERLLAGEPEPDGVQAYVATKLVLRQK